MTPPGVPTSVPSPHFISAADLAAKGLAREGGLGPKKSMAAVLMLMSDNSDAIKNPGRIFQLPWPQATMLLASALGSCGGSLGKNQDKKAMDARQITITTTVESEDERSANFMRPLVKKPLHGRWTSARPQ